MSNLYTEAEHFTHRRVLKNRPPPEEPPIDLYKLPLTKSTSVQRQSIHCINGAIGNKTPVGRTLGHFRGFRFTVEVDVGGLICVEMACNRSNH